jgi:hypothetical protein
MPGIVLACHQMSPRSGRSGAGSRAARSRLAGPRLSMARVGYSSSCLRAWSSIFVWPVRTEETGTTSPNLRHWLNVGVVFIRADPRLVIGRLRVHLRRPFRAHWASRARPLTISLAPTDMERKILLTTSCFGEHRAWREKGESLRAERCFSIAGHSLEQIQVRAVTAPHITRVVSLSVFMANPA